MGNTLDVAIRGKTDGLRQSLSQAKNDVNRFKGDVEKGGGLGGQFKELIGAYLGLEAIKGIIDYGDKIADLSQRFAVSAESLQRWGNVAEASGSSIEGVAGGLNKLEIARDKALSGDKEMIAHFKELGVSVEDLKSKSGDDLLLAIGGSAMHAADMVAVLGKSALELIPTLQAVADGSAEFGSVMSEATIQQLGEASDTLKSFGNTARVWVGGALAYIADKAREAGALIGMVVNLVQGVSWEDSIKIAGEQLQAIEDARNTPPPERRPGRDAEEPVDKEAKAKALGLAERLADLEEKNAAKQRSDREQIAELQMRQIDLEEQIGSAETNSVEQLKLRIDHEENAAEIAERLLKIEEDEVNSMKKSAEFRERIQKINEEAYDIRRKAAFEAMSTDEKISDLQRQIAENTSDAKDADVERTAELNKQRAELDGQLATLRQVKAEEDKRRMAGKVDRRLMSPAERRNADRQDATRKRAERAIRQGEANAAATKDKNGGRLLDKKARDDKAARQARKDRDFIGPMIPENMRPDFAQPANPVQKAPDLKAALSGTEGKLSTINTTLENRLKFPKLGGTS